MPAAGEVDIWKCGPIEIQDNAPQTSAKWTEFRPNAAGYLQLQDDRGLGFDGAASREREYLLCVLCVSPMLIVFVFCVNKALSLNKQHIPGKSFSLG